MNFEEQLRQALRRPEAPEGFAGRVLARVGEETSARGHSHARRRALGAAAAVLVLALGGWGSWRVEQQRRAERAAEDAVAALRIASEKINLARTTIERHSVE
ncbi:MAG TPA: hypothetical protein VGF40_19580 [Thermoanaerobaculia bacterium]